MYLQKKSNHLHSATMNAKQILRATSNKIEKLVMPREYRRIARIVERLARYNDLGVNSLVFTITAGGYTGFLASQASGNDNDIFQYRALDPFRQNYDDQTSEFVRQGYLFGDWEGSAYTNGTIAISRSTFRITQNEPSDAYLASTIAHELVHVLDAHSFNENHDFSIIEKENGRSHMKTKSLKAKLSRMYETAADEKGWTMMRKSGYESESYFDALKLMHESSGAGTITKPSDTHPCYEDRVKNLRKFILEQDLDSGETTSSSYTLGAWDYCELMNTLTFVPTLK